VVGKHLVMVLAAFFEVNNEDLLEPEGQLHEVIPFERSRHLSCRPRPPYSLVVEPVRRVDPEVLCSHVSASSFPTRLLVRITYHPQPPKWHIVHDHPSLLGNPQTVLLGDSEGLGQRL
jgi:hypothetical protein